MGTGGSLAASFNQGIMDTISGTASSTVSIVRDPGAAISNVYADYKKSEENPLCYVLHKAVDGVYDTVTASYNNGFNNGAEGFFYSLGQGTTSIAQTGVSAYGGQMLNAIPAKIKANKALNVFIKENPNLNRTVVGAYDVQTRNYAIMHSSAPTQGYVTPTMFNKANNIGGIGFKTTGAPNSVIGACAEFKAADILIENGSHFRNLRFTNAYKVKNGNISIQPTCWNCKSIFGDQI